VTALEHKEYRIQLTVRSLVVQLILEVRQTPHLASLTLALPQDAPPRLGTFHGALPPDAVLSIVWYPARVQPADWLPWLQPASAVEQAIHYPCTWTALCPSTACLG
jgi:hypothetical protein